MMIDAKMLSIKNDGTYVIVQSKIGVYVVARKKVKK